MDSIIKRFPGLTVSESKPKPKNFIIKIAKTNDDLELCGILIDYKDREMNTSLLRASNLIDYSLLVSFTKKNATNTDGYLIDRENIQIEITPLAKFSYSYKESEPVECYFYGDFGYLTMFGLVEDYEKLRDNSNETDFCSFFKNIQAVDDTTISEHPEYFSNLEIYNSNLLVTYPEMSGGTKKKRNRKSKNKKTRKTKNKKNSKTKKQNL